MSDSAFLRFVAYLDFLLRGRAAAVVGHRPDFYELTELSVTASYPEFVKIIKPEYARLADVLHLAFRERDPNEIAMPPDECVREASTAIGVLLANSSSRRNTSIEEVFYGVTRKVVKPGNGGVGGG